MSETRSRQSDRERWNRKYLEKGLDSLDPEPSRWLVDHAGLFEHLSGQRALDVACGNGRNARYLARLGFTVDALDVSEVAIDWLRDEVEREGLSVIPRRCDLEDEPLEPRAYDVVVNFNFLERRLFRRFRRALRPGGLLVFETFTRDHADVLGRALPAAFTLEPGELRRAFEDLEILDYRETIVHADQPERARAIASLVARAHKPALGRKPR